MELDERGNTLFEEFGDSMAQTLNKQWEENRTDEDVSKEDRHVLRLSAVLHVLYDQLNKRLNNEGASPPPSKVSEQTLKRAIRLNKYFAEQRKILDMVRVTPTMTKLVQNLLFFSIIFQALIDNSFIYC